MENMIPSLKNKNQSDLLQRLLKNKLLVLKNIVPGLENKFGWVEHKSEILENKTPLLKNKNSVRPLTMSPENIEPTWQLNPPFFESLNK
ncbi:hypothetical protein [Mesobacillus foraminis]|uniref:hypothetical protein n=1 Tax=Mesobacillus foraminis TaxID=279826 RepID=UPI001304D420|nr:hypothetical protein [Mesobacillus foraminis]